MKRFLAALLLVVLMASPAAAGTLKLATWNIYWLTETAHNKRTAADYERLQTYAERLDADVIALQEVENEWLLKKVFDPARYVFEVSTRIGQRDTQKTAFAIRRGVSYRRLTDNAALNVTGSLRHGTVIELRRGDQTVDVMAVHMKSGCFAGDLDQPSKDACKKLKRQIRPFEAWIHQRIKAGKPFIILGDFNRRLERRGDDFWREVNDGWPKEIYRIRKGNRHEAECWGGKYGDYIDHVIVGPLSQNYYRPGSFEELVYDETDFDAWHKKVSDHCPLSIDIRN